MPLEWPVKGLTLVFKYVPNSMMSNQIPFYDEPPNVGPHFSELEGDIVWVILRGVITGEQAPRLIGIRAEEIARLGGYFIIIDVRECHEPPEPEARQILMDWTKAHPPLGTAVIGGNFLIRTFATLANRAVSFLSKQPTPMRFFSSPEEGLGWFDQLRDEFQGTKNRA